MPVHALGTAADGEPALVMKRIEGVLWADLLQSPSHPRWAAAEMDRLKWNLEVLMQVCRAVEYAHSRGLAHRDLKPDNVMIGDFGETYVMDWGVSIALGALTGGPLKSDATVDVLPASLVGTPCYMAPEMLRRGTVSERTDVYLLGGILHEILTGEPPHRGDNFFAVLFSIASGEGRSFPPEAPSELVASANVRWRSIHRRAIRAPRRSVKRSRRSFAIAPRRSSPRKRSTACSAPRRTETKTHVTFGNVVSAFSKRWTCGPKTRALRPGSTAVSDA